MHSVSIHNSVRNRRIPDHSTRHVPALSTPEAADRMTEIISARLRDGWSLDQSDWQYICCDSTVIQVVPNP